LPADETFDVGVDTRTPVNDADYQVPFPFNGTIAACTSKRCRHPNQTLTCSQLN
jgi:hypothetical protein